METIINSPRLLLSLVTKAERGSNELRWLHELRSDEQATWWSINRRSKTLEDTERVMRSLLPLDDQGLKSHRVVYAVHEVLDPHIDDDKSLEKTGVVDPDNTRFIGLVSLVSLERGALPLPDDLSLPVAAEPNTLNLEVAYSFLPFAWSKGYATEAVKAVFESCRRADAFWSPYNNVYVRAIVNDGNPASLRVMAKVGMTEMGIYEWRGDPIFLAGEWTEKSTLHIFGMLLKSGSLAAPRGNPIDVEKQCGVLLSTGRSCARVLTCKSHSMGAKRAVPGRSAPYDLLLAQYQKQHDESKQH